MIPVGIHIAVSGGEARLALGCLLSAGVAFATCRGKTRQQGGVGGDVCSFFFAIKSH